MRMSCCPNEFQKKVIHVNNRHIFTKKEWANQHIWLLIGKLETDDHGPNLTSTKGLLINESLKPTFFILQNRPSIIGHDMFD